MHCLTKKNERLCIHTYLILKAGLSMEKSVDIKMAHEVERLATVEAVIKCVIASFPSATSDCRKFLENNKKFIDKLCLSKDIKSLLNKYVEKTCPRCKKDLVNWPHKTKTSYLISLAEIKRLKIETQFCKDCKVLVYYNLYDFGLVPVNNKVNK